MWSVGNRYAPGTVNYFKGASLPFSFSAMLFDLVLLAIADDPLSAKELEDMAKEYEALGVTYDIKNNKWYFNGEKVRYRERHSPAPASASSLKIKITPETLDYIKNVHSIGYQFNPTINLLSNCFKILTGTLFMEKSRIKPCGVHYFASNAFVYTEALPASFCYNKRERNTAHIFHADTWTKPQLIAAGSFVVSAPFSTSGFRSAPM